MVAYHDEEWGVPSHDDVHLFEMLTLEGAQAGLSWSTILNKREGYRRAFAGFDPAVVARFGAKDVERLLADPGIIRNRLKVESTVNNAARVLETQESDGSLDAYLWSFVDGKPDRQSLANRLADTGRDGPLEGDLEGPQAPRLPIRRADGDLRVHAVGRAWSTTTPWTASGARSQRDHVREVHELDRGAEGRLPLVVLLDLGTRAPQLLRRHQEFLDALGGVRVAVRPLA